LIATGALEVWNVGVPLARWVQARVAEPMKLRMERAGRTIAGYQLLRSLSAEKGNLTASLACLPANEAHAVEEGHE
jgi:hypothetical protein